MPAQEIIPSGIAKEATLQDVTNLLQELAIRLADIADSVGNLTPDPAGRLRTSIEAGGFNATIPALTTLSNQSQIGGYQANQHIVALTQMAEADLRRNIVIS